MAKIKRTRSFFLLCLLITSDIFSLFLSFLFWPLCCLSFFYLWLLITSLTSSNFSCPFYFGHCIVCPSSIYGFWLPLGHLQTVLVLFILAIVLSVLLPSMASDYLWHIQTFLVIFILAIVVSVLPSMASDYLWHLLTFLVLFILSIVLSVLLPSMASDYLSMAKIKRTRKVWRCQR
jgi:hypothetical protein